VERSLVLIKPDAMHTGLGGAIISRLERLGLKIVAMKMLHMDGTMAEKHYAVHKGKPFFDSLVRFMTSAPIMALVLEGEGAVDRIRREMGATDPAKAEPGTIRAEFGQDVQRNAVHGSDSPETAEKEIALFFSEEELFSPGNQ